MFNKKIVWFLSILVVVQTFFGYVVLRQFDLLHLHGIKQIVTGFRNESPVITFSRYQVFKSSDFNLQSDKGIRKFISSHQSVLPSSSNQVDEPKYSKIPDLLPGNLRTCASDIGLNDSLLQVDKVNSGSSVQYIFLNAWPPVAGIRITSLNPECSINYVRILQKTNTSWLVSNSSDIGLPESQLPARMDVSGNSGFLMSRFGNLYRFNTDDLGNRESFQRVTSATSFQPSNASESDGIAGEGVKSLLIYGSDIFYSAARMINGCGKLQLFSYSVDPRANSNLANKPTLLFQTSGCFKGPEVNLGAVGGKIILGEGNLRGQLVFSIGNPEIWQGFENIKVRQDLGRIVSINLETYAVRTISTGHRNPQGLCFESNTLWSTEQGPEGGDEINIIKSNRSYGWPYVTMGHAYGSLLDRDWINPFTDSGYEKPIFSYVPSVATGSLKCPSLLSPRFLRPDFFMATLRDTSIHRLRFESRRLVLDERIPIGSRVRDIDWLPNKELLVLTDSGEVLTLHFASIIN